MCSLLMSDCVFGTNVQRVLLLLNLRHRDDLSLEVIYMRVKLWLFSCPGLLFLILKLFLLWVLALCVCQCPIKFYTFDVKEKFQLAGCLKELSLWAQIVVSHCMRLPPHFTVGMVLVLQNTVLNSTAEKFIYGLITLQNILPFALSHPHVSCMSYMSAFLLALLPCGPDL